MKKRKQKLIAVILALAMMWESVPVRASGSAEAQDKSLSQTVSTEESAPPHIIAEDTDKRTETEKRFLLSAGTFMAVMYDTPVHYQEKDGSYSEIDNSFTEGTDEEGNAVYDTKQGPRKIKLAKKASAKKLITIHEKEYKFSWSFEGTAKVKASVIKAEQSELSGDEAFLTVTGLTSETRYDNVFPDVDLQYFVTPEGVKENLILKTAAARRSYRINYKTGNKLHAVQTDERTIELQKEDEVVYTISIPVMTDANGVSSDALTLTLLEAKNGELAVELTADSEWLDDPARAYPVTIDPSIMKEQARDSSISRVLTTNDYNRQATGTLYVGNQAGSPSMGVTRFGIKFPNLTTLERGDMIVNAKIYFYQNYYEGAANQQINVHEITADWYDTSSGNGYCTSTDQATTVELLIMQ